MGKKELAILIDSYADAKASQNKYLISTMIKQLEAALEEVFGADSEGVEAAMPSAEVTLTQEY